MTWMEPKRKMNRLSTGCPIGLSTQGRHTDGTRCPVDGRRVSVQRTAAPLIILFQNTVVYESDPPEYKTPTVLSPFFPSSPAISRFSTHLPRLV